MAGELGLQSVACKCLFKDRAFETRFCQISARGLSGIHQSLHAILKEPRFLQICFCRICQLSREQNVIVAGGNGSPEIAKGKRQVNVRGVAVGMSARQDSSQPPGTVDVETGRSKRGIFPDSIESHKAKSAPVV